MTMFEEKKSKRSVKDAEIIRRERQSDDDDKLVITIRDGKTSCVGGISPFDLLMFLGGGFPELFTQLCNNISEEDGGTLMKLLAVKLAINELQNLEHKLELDLRDSINED